MGRHAGEFRDQPLVEVHGPLTELLALRIAFGANGDQYLA